ncbi:MAG: cysteine desulfurase family protein [Planctomycetota bacterium]
MIYLDYNATTPILKSISKYLLDFNKNYFGNPVSLHTAGQMAGKEVSIAREKIANFFHTQPQNIIFTSSGAEANNMLLWGTFLHNKFTNPDKNHIITSYVEHPSILEPIKILNKLGLETSYIKCDKFCNVNVEEIEKMIRPQTFLISIMHSNNEVGTIQKVEQIKGIIKNRDDIIIHSDIAQSVGKMHIDYKKLNVDAITVSAHKFFGPKGIGALIFYKKPEITPIISGGIQEQGLRAGTHNLNGIIGFKLAVQYLEKNLDYIQNALKKRFEFMYENLSKIKNIVINTPPTNSINNTLNISVAGWTRDQILVKLDNLGICISTGTACLSGTSRTSHVLEALGISEELKQSAVRISFSHLTTFKELSYFIDTIKTLTTSL